MRGGMMVFLDVVYNHFGPEGNYLPKYFPQICSKEHCTPWGQALNFDGEGSREVREFIIENALYWIEEFHVDGLRLDAAHAMIDTGPVPILHALAMRAREIVGDRELHLILENDRYVPELLARDSEGKAGRYTAQWNHDMTHLLGASMASGSDEGSAVETGETERLGKALAEGYVIAAQEKGEALPCPSSPPSAFVAFLQTHDLIGNRVFGERIFQISPVPAVACCIYGSAAVAADADDLYGRRVWGVDAVSVFLRFPWGAGRRGAKGAAGAAGDDEPGAEFERVGTGSRS